MTPEERVILIKVSGLNEELRFVRSPHEVFWGMFESGTWEPETLALLVTQLGPGSNYVDIGAWIGPTCLVAAATGANVLAFEPDPVARGFLEMNISLNEGLAERIQVIPAALALSEGGATLSSAALGDSGSSLMRKTHQSVDVETMDIRFWARTEAFMNADMIKIDVEGFEYSLIPALSDFFRNYRPTVLLSVHGYVIRARFDTLPLTVARTTARLVSAYHRLRLIIALRRFQQRLEYVAQTGRWIPLRGIRLIRFLIQIRDTELLLSPVDVFDQSG